MAVSKLKSGDILFALKDSVSVFEGSKGNEVYQPFTSDIDGSISYLNSADTPTTRPLNRYVGDATPTTKRQQFVGFTFGQSIGNYTGVYADLDGVTFYQVNVNLKAIYGGGSESLKSTLGWVRQTDITNVESDLTAAVDKGDVKATKSELENTLAKNATVNTDTTTGTGSNNTILYGLGAVIVGLIIWLVAKKS
jgi:hypothetical protein